MTKVVTVYGKMRIPTAGHGALVDHAKQIAKKEGADLDVTFSGSETPLTHEQKANHFQRLFGIKPTIKPQSNFVSHLKELSDSGVEHVTVVAGSDRAANYQELIDKYNNKPSKKGDIPFKFKSAKVVQFGGERHEGLPPQHPSELKSDELLPYTSATNIEHYAKKGDFGAVRAMYPNSKEDHVRKLYDDIRQQHGLTENKLLSFVMWLSK
jgi:hypothetical protein